VSDARPYQTRTLADVREAFRCGAKAVLVVSPTGSGKTYMGSQMALGHVVRGGRAVWLSHRVELVEQASRALQAAGVGVGYRGLGASAPVQVCMVQTLARRDVAPDGTLVLFDEAHHGAVGNDWTRVWRGYLDAGARGVGLTATPARADDKALDGFDALVVSTSIRDLTAQGYLVPVRWKGPRRPTGKDRIAMTPAQAWDKFARGRATVVFAPHVQAATDYRDELRKVGARCEVVSERSTPEARSAALMSLEHGALDVVCNVQVLTEGWNCPRVSCVMIARRVGSQALWIQMTGRGLRPLAGKRDCLLLDLCGQAHLLGLPDEDRTYSLDGDGIALSRPAATAVRVCRVCGCQLAEGQVKCEECGKDHSLVTPISIGGELVDWRASYVSVRDSLQPSRQALALAGILRRAKASRIAWQPGAVIRRFKGIFGYAPSAETIAMAKELNAQADAELRRRART
jgi:DNA repair protein RadD